ncbi:MAG: hypothetical protein WA966_11825 [Ornithinimicrobium sp.]
MAAPSRLIPGYRLAVGADTGRFARYRHQQVGRSGLLPSGVAPAADPAQDADVRVVVQAGRDLGYTPFLTPRTQPLTSDAQRAEHTFTARRDYSSAQVAFQQDTVNDRAYQLCVDKVSLKPSPTPMQAADAIVQEGDQSTGPLPQADGPPAADSSTSPSKTPPGPMLAGLISLCALGAVLLNRRAANTMSRA